jgi:hypothetical protein
MARPNNKGWDFVEVGKTYQYKEDWFLALVKVLEDKSTDDMYIFRLQTEVSNEPPPTHEGEEEGVFTISHVKDPGGYYNGMMQLYKEPEYTFVPAWDRRALEELKLSDRTKRKDNFEEFREEFRKLVTGKYTENDIHDHYIEYKQEESADDNSGVWINDRLDLHSNATDSYWLKPLTQGGLVVETWIGEAIDADGESQPSVFLKLNEAFSDEGEPSIVVIITKSELEQFSKQLDTFELTLNMEPVHDEE